MLGFALPLVAIPSLLCMLQPMGTHAIVSEHDLLLPPPLTNVTAVEKLSALRSALEQHANMSLLQMSASGMGPLVYYTKDYYLVNVSMGSPEQWFMLQANTMSGDFWLIDSDCDDYLCNGSRGWRERRRFDKRASYTYGESEYLYDAWYYEGVIASDILSVEQVKARQTFVLAYTVMGMIGYAPFDGQLGLGWPATSRLANKWKAKTPLQNLAPYMDEKVFTLWIGEQQRTAMPWNPLVGGKLTFGARDKIHCANSWFYTPLTSLDIWQFRIGGFSVGSSPMNRRHRAAAVAFNFFGILGPTGNVFNIYEQTKATYNDVFGVYTVPCNSTETLPPLVFQLEAKKRNATMSEVRIQPRTYVQDWRSVINLGPGQCLLAVFPFENEGFGPAWFFGDAFLRSQCALFDIANQRMGFARNLES